MYKFLQNLIQQKQLELSNSSLDEFLTADEKTVLVELGLVKKESYYPSEYICSSCGEFHEIKYDFEKPFYVCTGEDGSKHCLDKNDLTIWRADISAFIKFLSHEFKVKIPVSVDDKLWSFGEIKINKVFTSLFLTSHNLKSVSVSKIEDASTSINKVVLCANTALRPLSDKGKGVLFVDLSDFLKVKNSQLFFVQNTFSRISKSFFRQVVFSVDGDLFVLGNKILSLEVDSRPYKFLSVLWRSFNKVLSNEEIYKTCLSDEEDDNMSYTAETFCHQMIKQIKETCSGKENKELLSKVIDQPKKKHYRLTNPL